MDTLPLARSERLVVQELGEEVLVYDLKIHKAFSLNETSSTVYKACDGKTSLEELKVRNNLTDEIIFLALDQLKTENLLEANSSYQSPFAGMSRRDVIRKVGLASMIALPVISSLVAPTTAMALSCLFPGGLPPGTFLGLCSEPFPSTSCTPSFCERPGGGTTECCSGNLTTAPGGCVIAGGIITCNCVCA